MKLLSQQRRLRNPHKPNIAPLGPWTTIRAKAPLEDLEGASQYIHVSSTLDFSYRTIMINLNEANVEKAGQAANAKMIKLGDCKITQIRFTPNFPIQTHTTAGSATMAEGTTRGCPKVYTIGILGLLSQWQGLGGWVGLCWKSSFLHRFGSASVSFILPWCWLTLPDRINNHHK